MVKGRALCRGILWCQPLGGSIWASPDPVSAGAHEATHTELSCLVGPLCTPVDVLSPRFEGACEVGDRVTIPNVGAYGLNASLANFLGHPYPVEIVVDGMSVVSRTRQTVIRERVDE